VAVLCLILFVLEYTTLGLFGLITWQDLNWLTLAFIIFEIYITAKRLHDCSISGWFSLLLFFRVCIVPGILFMCIYPGTKGQNKYGADPHWTDTGNFPGDKA
jgi:uncharacterized membrane protein YhaH (DUF805 family)